uniref:DUF1995 domain-containing protein n=1 Tax=Chromera velia CCMP2878 TaxID=1169474 RepID=A0A0G4FRE1_9ALVE|eukprot:Cvel_3657.t1-p1 / transcript=Cvel_3657.t1 / gene=Cvel_3657 / organism=Chromera_velia_CCMP2878 / gene_product=hypothetical protein / transcript_product=hypothetical protein / location=Cvel_scaffold151:60487-63070(+) / protein_length=278 / sequence_SO=supercontig / SO=protein_coding / is_pseudo=false
MLSTIAVQLPRTSEFGLEEEMSAVDYLEQWSKADGAKARKDTMSDEGKRQRSARETARVFLEMAPSSQAFISVGFPTEKLAMTANSIWGDEMKDIRFFSLSKELKKLKKKDKNSLAPKGKDKVEKLIQEAEARLTDVDVEFGTIPRGTRVLVLVAPRKEDLAVVRKIVEVNCPQVLCVLINADLLSVKYTSKEERQWFRQTFEHAYSLDMLRDWEYKDRAFKNAMIVRQYPEKWLFAKVRPVGSPLVWEEREAPISRKQAEKIFKEKDQGLNKVWKLL